MLPQAVEASAGAICAYGRGRNDNAADGVPGANRRASP
jgi:hypothetical protein